MYSGSGPAYVAFAGDRLIASGDLRTVARAAKETHARQRHVTILLFDGKSGPVEIDFRGSVGDVLARLPESLEPPAQAETTARAAPAGPGPPNRGGVGDVLARLPESLEPPATAEETAVAAPRGPGRPKLGVVAREVTLLPRQWEWLAANDGGADVAVAR